MIINPNRYLTINTQRYSNRTKSERLTAFSRGPGSMWLARRVSSVFWRERERERERERIRWSKRRRNEIEKRRDEVRTWQWDRKWEAMEVLLSKNAILLWSSELRETRRLKMNTLSLLKSEQWAWAWAFLALCLCRHTSSNQPKNQNVLRLWLNLQFFFFFLLISTMKMKW